ncbi:MAG: hypothetical protein MUF71_14265 [Candidatus Kapabacteria bacterium]|nr:hypothetical protein [Candidatus Kapabacteria bacterium]
MNKIVLSFQIAVLLLLFTACSSPYYIGLDTSKCYWYLKNKEFQWQRDTSTNVYYYTEQNSWAAKNIEIIKEKTEKELEKIKELSGFPEWRPHNEYSNNGKIDYFIPATKSRVILLTDAFPHTNFGGQDTAGGWSPDGMLIVQSINEQYFPTAYYPLAIAVIRAIDETFYPQYWVYAGVASYLQNHWQGYNIDEIAAHYLRKYDTEGRFIDMYKSYIDYRYYPIAIELDLTPIFGSLFKFIAEKRGKVYLKELIRLKFTRKEILEIEKEWKNSLYEKYAQSLQLEFKYWQIVEKGNK